MTNILEYNFDVFGTEANNKRTFMTQRMRLSNQKGADFILGWLLSNDKVCLSPPLSLLDIAIPGTLQNLIISFLI